LHDPAVHAFSDDEIDRFLALEKVIDADGYKPDNASWTPTYDVMRAAGRGWLWLAGTIGMKPLSYRIGDVWIMVDKKYCVDRANELMAAASEPLQRRDEQTEPDVIDGRYET
jgi:hypothetical protein